MARTSIYGQLHGEEVRRACIKIMGNAGYISQEELKVLQFMAIKGDYEDKRVILISKNSKLNNLVK